MNSPNITDWITAVAAAVTALGVILAWLQIRMSRKQAITQFEDSLDRQYRDIVHKLPIKAMLGEELSEDEYQNSLDDFFKYIDLTNGEVFLRQKGRISDKTWEYWLEGIQHNPSLPAFHRAWEEIKKRSPESFSELRAVEMHGFKEKPTS